MRATMSKASGSAVEFMADWGRSREGLQYAFGTPWY
jgi:hypothetical protein